MIGLDTNVLLRLLTDDPEEEASRQRAQVGRLIDVAEAAGEPLFVTDVVLCEVVWGLRRTYRVPRQTLRAILSQLVKSKHLAFESPEGVGRAVAAFESGRGDFADYLIRERAREAGCEAVVTFDRDILREDGFRAP